MSQLNQEKNMAWLDPQRKHRSPTGVLSAWSSAAEAEAVPSYACHADWCAHVLQHEHFSFGKELGRGGGVVRLLLLVLSRFLLCLGVAEPPLPGFPIARAARGVRPCDGSRCDALRVRMHRS